MIIRVKSSSQKMYKRSTCCSSWGWLTQLIPQIRIFLLVGLPIVIRLVICIPTSRSASLSNVFRVRKKQL